MEDQQIVELYGRRSEQAVVESDAKYGGYCYRIAHNILNHQEDARESVNDTWLDAWHAMPPHRPAILSTFLGKITRRIAIDRLRISSARKWGGHQVTLALEELSECVSGRHDVEEEVLRQERIQLLNVFLDQLSETERNVFLCRYWYLNSVETISVQFGFSQSKITSMLLLRIRQRQILLSPWNLLLIMTKPRCLPMG